MSSGAVAAHCSRGEVMWKPFLRILRNTPSEARPVLRSNVAIT